MEVSKSTQHFAHDDCDVTLVKRPELEQIRDSAAAKVAHDDPKFLLFEKRAIVFDDVGAIELREEEHFLLDALQVVLGLLEIDDLDRDDLPCRLLPAEGGEEVRQA